MDATHGNGVRAEGAGGESPPTERPAAFPPISLRKNLAWTSCGNAVYAGCQWAILMVLAKVGSARMVGQFALGLAVTAPVFMLANLQLRALQATDAKREYAFADYLGLRLVTTLLAQFAIAGIVLGLGLQDGASRVILAMALARTFESLSDVSHGLAQQHERLDRVARSMILRGVLPLAVVPAVVLAGGSLVGGVLAMAASWAAVLLVYDLPQTVLLLRATTGGTGSLPAGVEALGGRSLGVLRPRFHLPTLRRLAWLALPLGAVTLLASLNVNVPRYFIRQCVGEAELGIFAGFTSMFGAIYFVQTAIGQAALPRLSQYHAAGMVRRYLRLSGFILGLGTASGLAAVAVAMLGGAWLLEVVYSHEFARHVAVFQWLAAISVVQCIAGALSYFLNTTRRFHQVAGATLAGTAATAVSSAWLIPRFGLQGGAWAVLAGAAVSCALSGALFLVLIRSLKENAHAAGSALAADSQAGALPRVARVAASAPR